jgi:hypothetical protein
LLGILSAQNEAASGEERRAVGDIAISAELAVAVAEVAAVVETAAAAAAAAAEIAAVSGPAEVAAGPEVAAVEFAAEAAAGPAVVRVAELVAEPAVLAAAAPGAAGLESGLDPRRVELGQLLRQAVCSSSTEVDVDPERKPEEDRPDWPAVVAMGHSFGAEGTAAEDLASVAAEDPASVEAAHIVDDERLAGGIDQGQAAGVVAAAAVVERRQRLTDSREDLAMSARLPRSALHWRKGPVPG